MTAKADYKSTCFISALIITSLSKNVAVEDHQQEVCSVEMTPQCGSSFVTDINICLTRQRNDPVLSEYWLLVFYVTNTNK